jgi:hypothetical protein
MFYQVVNKKSPKEIAVPGLYTRIFDLPGIYITNMETPPMLLPNSLII